MVLPSAGCPWKDHLLELEQDLEASPQAGLRSSSPLVKYVLYVDTADLWRVQCVPKSKNSFENRSDCC